MDYDDWKTGWSTLGEDPRCTSCKDCEENDQRFDEAAEYLQGVLEQLYGDAPLNLLNLEHCLDELCYSLKVKTMRGDLNIARKIKEPKVVTPNWLDHWVDENNQYLKQMSH